MDSTPAGKASGLTKADARGTAALIPSAPMHTVYSWGGLILACATSIPRSQVTASFTAVTGHTTTKYGASEAECFSWAWLPQGRK